MDDIWGEYETSYDTSTTTYSDFTHTEYQWGTEVANDLYAASTDAWLAGDSYTAYELNVGSLEASAYADTAWDTWNTIDTGSYADTSSYSSYDTSSSYSSYDTSATDTSTYE